MNKNFLCIFLFFLNQLFDPVSQVGASARLDWFQAENYCKALGGHLATFDSSIGLSTVATAEQLSAKGSRTYWIGFNIIDKDKYAWVDGSGSTFTNWADNRPNNLNGIEKCAEISSNSFWNDALCYVNKY